MIAGGRVVRVENHVRRTTGSNMFRSGAFAALQVELMVWWLGVVDVLVNHRMLA